MILSMINKLEVKYPSGKIKSICINIRPWALEVVRKLKEHYRIVIYTASVKAYADTILGYLDPNNELFEYRYYREHCIHINNSHIKDLRLFTQPNSFNDTNWSLDELLLIDNSSQCFGFHINNGYPMLPFTDDPNDIEMVHLYFYLKSIALKRVSNIENYSKEIDEKEPEVILQTNNYRSNLGFQSKTS